MPDERKFETQYQESRLILDVDIKDMIRFWQTSGASTFVVHNTCAMLEELLKLREKVRNDATT